MKKSLAIKGVPSFALRWLNKIITCGDTQDNK